MLRSSSLTRESGGWSSYTCSSLIYISYCTIQGIWFYGLIQVTEIFNFSQDDLLTEDMVILDTHGEGFHLDWSVCVEPKEKQEGIFRGLHLVRAPLDQSNILEKFYNG
jgi:hypothetical protein